MDVATEHGKVGYEVYSKEELKIIIGGPLRIISIAKVKSIYIEY